MDMSGDAAEKIVRMSLDGIEVAARITGDNAERVAKLIFKAMKTPQKTKGKTSLSAMLKSNKPIKVFSIKDEELKKFCQEAKKYGVLYHVLKDKDETDGKCDIMVKEEDASKINRIFERFDLGKTDKDKIREAVMESKKERETEESDLFDEPDDVETKVDAEKESPEKEKLEMKYDDEFLNKLFGPPPANAEKSYTELPTTAPTGKNIPSEPSLSTPDYLVPEVTSTVNKENEEKPSVRKELAEYKKEEEKKEKENKQKTPQKSKNKTKHKSTKKKGEKEHVK